jgi:hypothetical protein
LPVEEEDRDYVENEKQVLLWYRVKTIGERLTTNAEKLNGSPAQSSLDSIEHSYYEPAIDEQYVIDEATADKEVFKANTTILNAGKGKSLLAEYLEMAKPDLTEIQASARRLYPYDDKKMFEMGMITYSYMRDFLGNNYTPTLNRMKEIYAELAGDQYHV